MEQHPQGLLLTERSEFVLWGQIHRTDRHQFFDNTLAIDRALTHLEKVEDDPPKWVIPNQRLDEARDKLKVASSDFQSRASGRSKRAQRFYGYMRTSQQLLDGVHLQLGVPPENSNV